MPSHPRRGPLAAALLGAVVAGAISATAYADPAPPYAALLMQAQGLSPRLAEGAADVRRAEGLALQAEARPNPTAGLTVEGFGGSGPYSGLGGAETTLSVGQPLELGGKRPARIAAGRADIGAARARLNETRAAFARDLALAYAEAEAADRRAALAREVVSLAEDDARAVRALVDAGKDAEVRGLTVEAAVAAARAEADAARAETEQALARLTALAGAAAPFTGVAPGLLAAAPPAQAGAAAPAETPAIASALAAREAAASRAKLERARASPDVTVSVGLRRYGLEDATALVAGVSAPFPLFDRNRGNQAAANAEVQAAEARLAAARLDAEADFRAGRSQAVAAQGRADAAARGEEAAAEAYRLTRIGYESGKSSLLELTAARRAVTDTRIRTLDAQLARVRAEAALAQLQGRAPFGDRLP